MSYRKLDIKLKCNNAYIYKYRDIEPLTVFDLSDNTQFKKACGYKNLQPLWVSRATYQKVVLK